MFYAFETRYPQLVEYLLTEVHVYPNPAAESENGTGFVSRRNARPFGLDDLSTDWLLTKSLATNKSPAQIIGEMVRERIAAAL